MNRVWLRPGDITASLGGLLLIGIMFATWFERNGVGLTAWVAYSSVDIIMAILALPAAAIAFLTLMCRTPAIPLVACVFAFACSCVAALLILICILAPPSDSTLEAGVFIGLAAALLAATGAWWAMHDERPRREQHRTTGPTLPPPPREAS